MIGSPKIRIPEAEGLPNSAQKRREAVLVPERPREKGKEGGGKRGGGEEGPYLLFYGHLYKEEQPYPRATVDRKKAGNCIN